MCQCVGIGQIIDREDAFDVALLHGAKNVASDASEAVNSVICHNKTFSGLTISENVGIE